MKTNTSSFSNQKEVSERLEYFELIFANIKEYILLLSATGEILMFNNSWKELITRMTSTTPSVGKSIFETMPQPHDNWKKMIEKCAEGKSFDLDVELTLSGENVTHRIKHVPVMRGKSLDYIMISGEDVTAQRLAEKSVAISERNLRCIFQNTSEMFVLMDEKFTVELCNESFVSTWLKGNISNLHVSGTGLSTSEIIGRNIFEFIDDSRKAQATEIKKIIERNGKINYVKNLENGVDARWFNINLQRIERTGGHHGYAMSIIDQTDFYRTKKLLELSEQRFRGLAENSRDVFFIVNNEQVCTYVSPNVGDLLGFAPSDIIGKSQLNIIHSADSLQVRKDIDIVWSQPPGHTRSILHRARHKDGSSRNLEGVAINLSTTRGISGVLFVVRDITERVQRDQQVYALNKSLSEFQKAINAACIVSRTDPYGRITFVNNNFVEKSGYSREELIGATSRLINSGVHSDEFWKDMWITISNGQVWRQEIQNRAKNGSVYWEDTFIMPILGEDGRIREYLSIRNDVTERKMVEEITTRYNERFELASKATSEAIWDWDIEHDVESWNHGLKTIFGYNVQTIMQPDKWWQEKIHPDDYQHVRDTISNSFAQMNEHWSLSYRYKCADGTYKNVLDRAYIVYRNGIPVRMIGAMQDVTAEVHARSEIERLSLVARHTTDAVLIANGQNLIEWVNDSFSSLTGYDQSNVLGRDPLSVLLSDSDPATAVRIKDTVESDGSASEEVVGLDKYQNQVWQQLTVKTIKNEKNEPSQFIYIAHDITDRKKSESRILATARELTDLIDNANVPIMGIDKEGNVCEWNKVAANITGFSWAEILTTPIRRLLNSEDSLRLEIVLHEVFDGKSISNYELRIINRSGIMVDLFAAFTPKIDVNGVIIGATIVAQDLTELLQYRSDLESLVVKRTRELNHALEKEKEIVEMKSRFVSVASHEFRTPLTSITIASSTLRKFRSKMSASDIEEKLDFIENQVKHMTWLLDDVLMIGKAEAGTIKVSQSPIKLNEFLTKISAEVENSMGNSHQVKTQVDLENDVISGDEKLMRNIVINLLTNAIKFSPGKSSVALSVKSISNFIHLSVTDEGIGIPENDLDNLFKSFQRGSNTDKIEGTGLGLSIVKRATEILGGSISVQSRMGEGTTFVVELPLDNVSNEPRQIK